MTDATTLLRPHAEQLYAKEIEALKSSETKPLPPNWQMSPQSVVTYLMGGKAADGTVITPKYIGKRHVMEVAVATLATDRALLLLGVPGTAKTWVSEHLTAAVCNDSTRTVQGTSGTTEEALRYGWNYAQLLTNGPSNDALVPGPVMEAMAAGSIVRIEELTRIPSETQDALISILSEKTLTIPELGAEVQAEKGFNTIATANNRDRGVNDLSSALRRRFNTVVLPLPSSLEDEVSIVSSRMASLGTSLELPKVAPADEQIRRVVQIFRELRNGVTDDGRTKLKTPSGTLSTAEAISVMVGAWTMSAHFGDGAIEASDLAGGLTGAIVQDETADLAAWREYLETVVKRRKDWSDIYRASRERI